MNNDCVHIFKYCSSSSYIIVIIIVIVIVIVIIVIIITIIIITMTSLTLCAVEHVRDGCVVPLHLRVLLEPPDLPLLASAQLPDALERLVAGRHATPEELVHRLYLLGGELTEHMVTVCQCAITHARTHDTRHT